MKKSFIIVFYLVGAFTFAIGESSQLERKYDGTLNRILMASVDKAFTKSFEENISKYNQDKNTKKYPIVYRNQIAVIKVGKTVIKFSADTLFEKYVYVGRKKVFFPLDKKLFSLNIHSSNNKLEMFLSIFIHKAYANVDQKIEDAIYSVLIMIGENFNSSFVFSGDDLKNNLAQVEDDLKKLNDDCQNGRSLDSFAQHVDSVLSNSNESYDQSVKEKSAKARNKYFKATSGESLSCENLLRLRYKADQKALLETAYDIRKNEQSRLNNLEKYAEKGGNPYHDAVTSSCKTYMEFRSCLLKSDSFYGEKIYNNARGDGSRDQAIPRSIINNKEYKPAHSRMK